MQNDRKNINKSACARVCMRACTVHWGRANKKTDIFVWRYKKVRHTASAKKQPRADITQYKGVRVCACAKKRGMCVYACVDVRRQIC
eukprot:GDKI01006905.1.p3 GENE.GDKI01006905.1~~GDKI01006905.1.p3  ORF type:complete len:100 (+),score=41.40 GDKI01006905.1:40-300(+)